MASQSFKFSSQRCRAALANRRLTVHDTQRASILCEVDRIAQVVCVGSLFGQEDQDAAVEVALVLIAVGILQCPCGLLRLKVLSRLPDVLNNEFTQLLPDPVGDAVWAGRGSVGETDSLADVGPADLPEFRVPRWGSAPGSSRRDTPC